MAETTYSYFPGCSLATTAKENNASMINFAKEQGITLVELEDWNCCGSSSAHSIDHDLADRLAMRNLSLAPPDRPLLIACPSCNLRLQQANMKLQKDEEARHCYQKWFGKPPTPDLKIVHFFELMDQVDWKALNHLQNGRLKGLKFAPYYGCMLAKPPSMRHMKSYHGVMEKILSGLGAAPVSWGYGSRCCGTFLSVVRPDVVTEMVHQIVNNAKYSGADCIITACAMCHMNLEIRSDTQEEALPIFHFSEILSLAFQHQDTDAYFARHLIDPRPMLKQCQLIP
jgi:heterodisulfide reductase subunit B